MNNLNNEQIMDYLDGTLSESEMARVESHLKENAEDAELVKSLKFAVGEAKAWHAAEPMRVSENFWPQLRDKLGPAPKRSFLGRFRNSITGAFVVSPVARLSVGAAVMAVILGMGAFLFAPQDAVQPGQATPKISLADRAFIQRSVAKHQAYVAASPATPGEAASVETGADDEESHDN